MNVTLLLHRLLERNASDLYLTVGSPPVYRVEGVATPTEEAPLTPDDTAAFVKSILSPEQQAEFRDKKEMNLALSLGGVGRFRANVFQQRGSAGVVIRQVKINVPTLLELGLPPILAEVSLTRRGLVLIVGATGSGKSTTLAAMIDHRNTATPGHIVTIEDPIEFMHRHKRSIVSQREVGFDTLTFHDALRNTLRQAPDVILIGEVRDTITMEAAIAFAETGHLCLATLHSNNANQAIERILNFFPVERHVQILLQLSMNLRAIVAQRLIASASGLRVAALEILMDTPRIRDLIRKGEVESVKDAMEQGASEGCQTFDQSLLALHVEGKIGMEEALANADRPNDLRIRFRNEDIKRGAVAEPQTFKIEGHERAPVKSPLRKH